MTEDDVAKAGVLAALDQLRDALWDRNPAFVGQFADEPDTLLIGSDRDEVALGRGEIGALVRTLFALPARFRWEWRHRAVSIFGGLALLSVACDVVVAGQDGEIHKPYRITGVLRRSGETWEWLQFHGSQPADG